MYCMYDDSHLCEKIVGKQSSKHASLGWNADLHCTCKISDCNEQWKLFSMFSSRIIIIRCIWQKWHWNYCMYTCMNLIGEKHLVIQKYMYLLHLNIEIALQIESQLMYVQPWIIWHVRRKNTGIQNTQMQYL